MKDNINFEGLTHRLIFKYFFSTPLAGECGVPLHCH